MESVGEHNGDFDEVYAWRQLRKGNKIYFDKIYQRFARPLYNYGCKFSSDRGLVEDCLQDLFVDLWVKRKSLGETTSVRFYLLASLKRRIIQKIKGNQRIFPISSNLNETPQTPSYEFQLILSQTRDYLTKGLKKKISKLPPRQKEVIYLRFYQGLSFPQISVVMNIDVKSVYKLVYKAVASLSKYYGSKKKLIDSGP